MTDQAILMLGWTDVSELLRGQESAIMQTVEEAYVTHGRGDTVVPHSTFLRFFGGRDRAIALPALLGGRFDVAGLKWIASVPDNVTRGLARASGLVVLNETTSGRPWAILEGSVVSATRTAASAALAARVMHEETPAAVGVLGCGVINFEVVRFLVHVWPGVRLVIACDLDSERAAQFTSRCRDTLGVARAEVECDWRALLGRVSLLSIATTAMSPHVDVLSADGPLRTVLHLSLRDLAPEIVLAADNVVDDAAHVCRAETSLHLAERLAGDRTFIRCELANLLAGSAPPKRRYDAPTIFSPFGLGVLDIAVAKLACERAAAEDRGVRIPFLAGAVG